MRYAFRLANLLGAAVLGVHDLLVSAANDEAERGGATAAALATLTQYEGLSQEQLRGCLGISQPATVRLVDALVAGGLAERGPGPDRRTLSITLTEDGHRRAGQVLAARAAALEPLLDGVAAADRASLVRVLEHVLTRLTTDVQRGDQLCRLCDIKACPLERCPVECAIRAHRPVDDGPGQ